MGLIKKDRFYVGWCAFVMPLILVFSAYGASSVRSISGAVPSAVAKANANTARVSSVPLVSKKNIVASTSTTTVAKGDNVTASDSQQRMPFGVHVSSTAVPTSTSSDISSAQQRGELIERTSELEERAGNVEDRATVLEDRAEVVEGRATILEERTEKVENRVDALEGRADVVENRAGVLEERATKVENRATAVESRAKALENRADTAESEITKLHAKDAEHDTSIQNINIALSGKQKTLQGSKYISIIDSDDGTVSTISATYNTGTADESGLTKLYSGIGSETNGTMTQKAITDTVNTLNTTFGNRSFALEGRVTDLETGLSDADSEISDLHAQDEEFSGSIKEIKSTMSTEYGATVAALNKKLENTATGANSFAVGGAAASGSGAIAVGKGASVSANGAIQLGQGTNTTVNTMNVSLAGNNYQLLDANAKIPAARLVGANGANGQLLQSNGNGGMTWVNIPSKVRNTSGTAFYDMWVDTGN